VQTHIDPIDHCLPLSHNRAHISRPLPHFNCGRMKISERQPETGTSRQNRYRRRKNARNPPRSGKTQRSKRRVDIDAQQPEETSSPIRVKQCRMLTECQPSQGSVMAATAGMALFSRTPGTARIHFGCTLDAFLRGDRVSLRERFLPTWKNNLSNLPISLIGRRLSPQSRLAGIMCHLRRVRCRVG